MAKQQEVNDAGKRFKLVLNTLGWTHNDASAFFDVKPGTIARWKTLEQFSPRIFAKVNRLSEKGINPGYMQFNNADLHLQEEEETPVSEPVRVTKSAPVAEKAPAASTADFGEIQRKLIEAQSQIIEQLQKENYHLRNALQRH